jgi:indole-3-glycerol phosphate synthase
MALPGILGRIVERTLEDVASRRNRVAPSTLEERARIRAAGRRGFRRRLERGSGDPVRLICEIKKASPSKGVLAPGLDPARLAAAYRDGGAAAVSVVTEPHFFQGDAAFAEQARTQAPDLPFLRKDFHVDELQVWEAAGGDWDALLLIAAALAPSQLKDYLDMADAFALDHLVEVATPAEAEIALKAGARVVGVNNRDLATFDVDLRRTEVVLPLLREAGVVAVSESGITGRDSVIHLERAGVDALLVGEALVTAGDPEAALRVLLDTPRTP